jgi:hypothetical protein
LKKNDYFEQLFKRERPNYRYIEKNTDLNKHNVIDNNPRDRVILDQLDYVTNKMVQLNRYLGGSSNISKCLRIAIQEIDHLHSNQLQKENNSYSNL